jgi:hypothetical protein
MTPTKYQLAARQDQWRTEGRGLGGFNTPLPPPPTFQSFDKVDPDCKNV